MNPQEPNPQDPEHSARAWAPFEGWVRACRDATSEREHLSEDSATKYRTVWSGYLKWLARTQTDWAQANEADISAFVQAIGSRPRAADKGRTSGSTRITSASPVTQRRYWRVLRDVYSHAVINGQITANPCSDAEQVPPSETMPSMVLPPWVLGQLQSAILLERQLDPLRSWQDLRNDTLVMLLCHTAIKTGEIQTLRLDQLLPTRTARHGKHLVLTLEGQRKYQTRAIPITDPKLLVVLRHWLYERSLVENAPAWLFFGQKRRPGARERMPLSAKSIFLIVNQAITRYIGADAFAFNLAHAGPEALRNTVITHWLGQGREPEDVMLLAGMAEQRALLRLMPEAANASPV